MLARGQAAPLRFLLAVLLAWTIVRGVAIQGWNPFVPARMRLGPPPGWMMARWPHARALPPPIALVRDAADGIAARLIGPAASPRRHPPAEPDPLYARAGGDPIGGRAAMGADALRLIALDAYRPVGRRAGLSTGMAHARAIAGEGDDATAPGRLSGSLWLFARGGGGARALSNPGQIGGGQAGARLLYRLDGAGTLAASARISGAVGGARQTEAAVGIDWRPLPAIPLHLTVERRIAIDRGGRDAVAAGAAGGVYDVRPAQGWRLDGYAEAGIVGARRRDPDGDGAARIGRELAVAGAATLTLGAGAWGAAQPGAARLDAGPSAVARMPVAGHTVAAALDYRARIAGGARPGSGLAFMLGVDF